MTETAVRRPITRPAAAATALRFAGASFADIAEMLGVESAEIARRMVESDLASQPTHEDRDWLRKEEAARIERLIRSVWRKATAEQDPEHLPAVRMALSLIDRHARLLGLDMPTEVVVYTPQQREIEDWVGEVLSGLAPHMGLIEAEVIEDAVADGG